MGVLRRATLVLATLALALGLSPAAAVAAGSFETPSAEAVFGESITVRQAFTADVPLARVEVLLTFPDSLGPYVVQAAGSTAAGRHELTYRWSIAEDGHLVPNTPITARWRLVPADRDLDPIVGPPVTVRYEDTRFDWKTVSGDLVRLHWYEGSAAFGRRALEIGERAVADAAAFLGVTESEPIDFYVYADEKAFLDALGPAVSENVGGQAHPDIRTLFAQIAPSGVTDPWVRIVVPHELTHIVFDTAVENPYHYPPRWLNEGVAVYLSEGYTASDRGATEGAARAGRLMPLQALGGQFPSSAERFSLAYSESVSAVDFLVREKGADALVALINRYADGVTDDEAFESAVGTDLAGFEAAWLADLGADAPPQAGPQPAAAGPLPPGWDEAAAPAPGDGASPPASARPAPADPGDDGSPWNDGLVIAVVALAGLLVGGSIAYGRRRRSGPPAGPPSAPPPWDAPGPAA